MPNEKRMTECKAIGDIHIIVMSKEKLAQFIKQFPYKPMSNNYSGAYPLQFWEESKSKIHCGKNSCWYDEMEDAES